MKSQKGFFLIPFCSLEEFDGIQQVCTEYLLGTRSCAKILGIQRYLRMGQPWRGPSLEGLPDIHTTEL